MRTVLLTNFQSLRANKQQSANLLGSNANNALQLLTPCRCGITESIAALQQPAIPAEWATPASTPVIPAEKKNDEKWTNCLSGTHQKNWGLPEWQPTNHTKLNCLSGTHQNWGLPEWQPTNHTKLSSK